MKSLPLLSAPDFPRDLSAPPGVTREDMSAPQLEPPPRLPIRRLRTGVVRARGAYLTITLEAIRAGEVILTAQGEEVDRPSRTSLQVDEGVHLEVPAGLSLARTMDAYQWRFLDHSCDPAASFRGRELVALRDLPAWSLVTFDYNTTEYELAEPFHCECGSPSCQGEQVRGFRHLDAADRRRRLPHLASHLRRLLEPGEPEQGIPRG
jgi:hypothetical protein